jgi:hypothetical protein
MNKAQAIAAWQGNQIAAAKAAEAGKSLLKQPGWRELKETGLQNYIPELKGGSLVHGSEIEVKTVRGAHRAAISGAQQIEALKALGRSANWADMTDPQKAMAQSLVTQLQLTFKDQANLGVLSESDMKMIATVVEDPTAMFQLREKTEAKLDMLASTLAQGARNSTKGLLVEPVELSETRNPKGEVVRVVRSKGETAPQEEQPVTFKPVQ